MEVEDNVWCCGDMPDNFLIDYDVPEDLKSNFKALMEYVENRPSFEELENFVNDQIKAAFKSYIPTLFFEVRQPGVLTGFFDNFYGEEYHISVSLEEVFKTICELSTKEQMKEWANYLERSTIKVRKAISQETKESGKT